MSKTAVVEVLREARALIEDPERWTTDCYARTRDNQPSVPEEPEAVRWCAAGATWQVAGYSGSMAARAQLRAAAENLWGRGIAGVNDRLGHDAVLEMFDYAIALAEQRS